MTTGSKNNSPRPWEYGAAFLFLAAVVLMLMLNSCSPRIIQNSTTEKEKVVYRDSIAYRDTTIYIQLPLERDQAIVHVGDTSIVETSLALSMAWVDSTGFLHQKIENKTGPLRIVVHIPARFIFNEVTKEKAEYLTKIEYREKSLSWWQKFRQGAFWWLVGAVLLLLVWTFRNVIFKII